MAAGGPHAPASGHEVQEDPSGGLTPTKVEAMSVHARSDVVAVSISRDHGGCGVSHSRPVIDGSPVVLWTLTCDEGCEDVLRKDPLWASDLSTIPETPDEEQGRLNQERLGMRDQASATQAALTELAKLGDLPAALARLAEMMNPPQQARNVALTPSDYTVQCPNGHGVSPGAAFCSTCGTSMSPHRPAPEDYGPDDSVRKSAPTPDKVTDPVGDLQFGIKVPTEAPTQGVVITPTAFIEVTNEDVAKVAGPDAPGVNTAPTVGVASDAPTDYESMTVAELNELARKIGARVARIKATQIENIKAKLSE